MGAKSTLTVTRREALEWMFRLLEDAPDGAIAGALEALAEGNPEGASNLGVYGSNFKVVGAGGAPQEAK